MKNDSVRKVLLTRDNVKLIGRTRLFEDTLWLALSGTGAEFIFSGKRLAVDIVGDEISETPDNGTNYARIAIYVNGKRAVDDMIDKSQKSYVIFDGDTVQNANVKIIKLSECAMSAVGIKPLELAAGDTVSPCADKRHSIEFIGDSITCGYGVDDEVGTHNFSTATEDVTRAYAYKTAQILDADYSMFSVSGYGIISGYTESDTKIPEQTVPQYYESLGFSYGSFSRVKPQDIPWNFSCYVPEIIVINLGTNDDSYCKDYADRQDEYTREYVKFLKTVRKHNPNAKIFMTAGIMGQRIFPAIEKARVLYQTETGDENVVSFMFDEQLESDGMAANYHPTERTHEKAAAALAKFIVSETDW